MSYATSAEIRALAESIAQEHSSLKRTGGEFGTSISRPDKVWTADWEVTSPTDVSINLRYLSPELAQIIFDVLDAEVFNLAWKAGEITDKVFTGGAE